MIHRVYNKTKSATRAYNVNDLAEELTP